MLDAARRLRPVRGDGDDHMRGIGCLLTGIELFPGNIQGGSRHAGRLGQAASRSTRRSRTSCRRTRRRSTRFGSLEFGVHGARPGRHLDAHGLRRRRTSRSRRSTTRTRCSTSSTAGRRTARASRACSTTLQDDLKKVGARRQRRGPPAARRARHVRPRDGAGAARPTTAGRRPRRAASWSRASRKRTTTSRRSARCRST